MRQAGIVDPTMAAYPQEARNGVMVAYLVALLCGDNLVRRPISASTAKRYVDALVQISTKAIPPLKVHIPDPTVAPDGSTAEAYDSVMAEQQRWEEMPNRREPLTKAMVASLSDRVRAARRAGHDARSGLAVFLSQDAALRDWLAFGLQAGCRRSEFAQETQHAAKIRRLPTTGEPVAFIMGDLRFYGPNRRRIPTTDATVVTHACSVDVQWRSQKNGDHGQVITYHVNPTSRDLCPVQALLNIRRRWQLLGCSGSLPLAVFRRKRQTVLLSSTSITACLRDLAKSVYNITDKAELKRYSCHSIRVGACVQLHVAGMTTDFIKKALRWRSDAFQMYLRNVGALAAQRNKAINDWDPDGPGTHAVARVEVGE